MEDNQNTAIATANQSASTRADNAVQGISTSTLEATPTRMNVPNSTTPVPELPIYSFTTQSSEEQQRQSQLNEGRKSQGDTLGDIYSGLADIGTRGETTMRLEEKAGIPTLSKQLTEIENELTAKSLAFRRERERITTAGGSKAQIDQILSEVGRKQNQELADLEVIRAARSNTLTNAQNLINRKVELEFADKQAKVDALKFIYSENKSILDKEDDRLFQQAIRREERGFEIAKQQYIQTETEKMRYVANAAQAGADNNTLKAIQGAKTLDELYGLSGIQQFAMSKAEKLDMAYKQAQIANIYDTINSRGVEEYNARLEDAVKLANEKEAASEKSLAVAAIAAELQTAEGLNAAIGFGIKKSTTGRTLAGAGTGAAVGAGVGSIVPLVGTAMGAGVGTVVGGVTGFFSSPDAIPGTTRADYEAKADRLVSLLTVDNLKLMSGVLSDTDIRILENAGSTLGNRNVSESEWMVELQRVSDAANRAVQKSAQEFGLTEEQMSFWGRNADGSIKGTEFQVDPITGNILLPGNTPIKSNTEFFNQ